VIIGHRKGPTSRRGPIGINPATRDTLQNIAIRRVEKVNGRLVNVEFEAIQRQGFMERDTSGTLAGARHATEQTGVGNCPRELFAARLPADAA
jgi:hypothetical protein